MFGVIGKMLGSGNVIEKGMDLIDSKIDLMSAYTPSKIAQRYLALMFGLTFLGSYVLVLAMTISGQGDPEAVTKVMEQFSINYAMLIILGFYFGGGAVEGFLERKKK